MSQTIRITSNDMETVFSELAAHKGKPINHPNCEFCDWVRDFIKSAHGQKLAEDSANATVYMDRLFFLYCGVRIGRNQGVEDLIADMDKEGVDFIPPPRKDEN